MEIDHYVTTKISSATTASKIAPKVRSEFRSRRFSAPNCASHGPQPSPHEFRFALDSLQIRQRDIVVAVRWSTRGRAIYPGILQIRVLNFDPGSCRNGMRDFHPRFSQSWSDGFDPFVDCVFDFRILLRASF